MAAAKELVSNCTRFTHRRSFLGIMHPPRCAISSHRVISIPATLTIWVCDWTKHHLTDTHTPGLGQSSHISQLKYFHGVMTTITAHHDLRCRYATTNLPFSLDLKYENPQQALLDAEIRSSPPPPCKDSDRIHRFTIWDSTASRSLLLTVG